MQDEVHEEERNQFTMIESPAKFIITKVIGCIALHNNARIRK